MFFIELLLDYYLNYRIGKGFIGYIIIVCIWIFFEDFFIDKYLVEVKFIYSNLGLFLVLY